MSHSINRRFPSEDDNENDIISESQDSDDPMIERSDVEGLIKRTPIDKYNFAYLVFYLLGINTLIPWNFFVTAEDYWNYKFRNVSANESHIHFTYDRDDKTPLQASFTSYLCIASSLPNTIFLIINTFLSNKISLSTRMIGSQGVILAVFIVTTSFVQVNTDSYQDKFLLITLSCVAVVNAAAAIFGGSLCGVVGKFSSNYITAMTAGQALAGIFSALTEILSLWIGANAIISGLLYFIIADCVIFVSLIAYIILERIVFFKHHVVVRSQDPDQADFSIHDEVNLRRDRISYLKIFKKTWPYNISIFSVFVVTMLVCPAVTVLVESQHKGHGHAWNDVYFVPVVTFLAFSCADYAGRIISGSFCWPKNKPRLVVLLTLLRILFIPAFLVCNAQPRHNLPVLIHEDIYYIILTILFGFTNGYFCNITFMLTPTVVEPNEKEIASAMMGAFLGIGISVGSACSFFMLKLL